MTRRFLPKSEWSKLDLTTAKDVWRDFDERFVDVAVVEEDGHIIGHVVVMSIIHAECLASHEDHHKKSAVVRALWEMASEKVTERGGKAMWASAIDPEMKRMLSRHSKEVPMSDHFILPVLDSCRLS